MKLPAGHVAGVGVHKATAYGGLGEKLLKGWGWEKGQGVGKNKQGISEAIEVVKKDDNAGIGGNNAYKWEEKWWEAAFNANAQAIKEVDSDVDSDTDSDSDSDSDDDTQLTTCQAGLLRNRDGTVASSSSAELAIAASVAKDARGWAGRFGGREGKMGRIRRQEAEAEEKARIALGLPAPSTSSASALGGGVVAEGAQKTKKSKTESESKPCKKRKQSNEKADCSAASKKNSKKSKAGAPVGVVRGGSAFEFAAAACTAHVAKPTQRKNWWGASYFVSAGYMESMEETEEEHKRQTFSENDQENLYNKTQDRKVAKGTRLGLGVRGSEVKIAGGKFEGTKKTFDDGEGEGEEQAGPSDRDEALAGVKWKKIITKTLQGAPKGSMKVKKLQKAVAAAVLAKLEATVCVKYLEGVVMQKLNSSSKFVVDGKSARCC